MQSPTCNKSTRSHSSTVLSAYLSHTGAFWTIFAPSIVSWQYWQTLAAKHLTSEEFLPREFLWTSVHFEQTFQTLAKSPYGHLFTGKMKSWCDWTLLLTREDISFNEYSKLLFQQGSLCALSGSRLSLSLRSRLRRHRTFWTNWLAIDPPSLLCIKTSVRNALTPCYIS